MCVCVCVCVCIRTQVKITTWNLPCLQYVDRRVFHSGNMAVLWLLQVKSMLLKGMKLKLYLACNKSVLGMKQACMYLIVFVKHALILYYKFVSMYNYCILYCSHTESDTSKQ